MGCGGSKAVSSGGAPTQAPAPAASPAANKMMVRTPSTRVEMPTDPDPRRNPAHPLSRSSSTASSNGAAPRRKGATVHDDYDMFEVLGKGGFGEVRRGKRKADGKVVAIKMISKLTFKSQADHDDMINEVQLMERLKGHPNVCEQITWYEDRTGFYVVLELANGGELMERIQKLTHFSEKVAAWYFRQMLLSLQHCHTNLVVHRDRESAALHARC